ncbi:MAG: PAS domain-containing protein, partial [Paracoccaceae bacterium]
MTAFEENLWLSLPVPGFVMDEENRIAEVNPAAENFLNASVRQLRGTPVFDAIAIDAPLDDQIDRVRSNQASLYLHNVDVGGGGIPSSNCNIQIAPMAHMQGYVLMLIEPRMLAEKLGRSLSAKSAAKSAIGMGEMLAHEIKNP